MSGSAEGSEDMNRDAMSQPMEGHGAYNRNSRVQAGGNASAIPFLVEAAYVVPLAAGAEPVVIADYGCSQGHNSLAPVGAAIGALRPRIGPDRAISVVHTDLPGNDYAALFQTLAEDADSYLRNEPLVFPSAIGRSFYEVLLPPESVTIGWSSWSVQWLSRTPAPVPDQVQVAYSDDQGAREAFAAQAATDWRSFLSARALELRPGGRLVVLTMASDEQAGFGYRCVLMAIQGALLDLVGCQRITEAEAQRMVAPTYGRSRAELLAPFTEGAGFAGLSVHALKLFRAEDHIWIDSGFGRDAAKFGASWAAFSRASIFPTLASGLDGGAADPRAPDFMAALEAAVARRLAAAPEESLVPLAVMVLAKP